MSDIDIERLREWLDKRDRGFNQPPTPPTAVLKAVRFLLSLADEGGELWAGAVVTDESRHVVRNAVCWALYGDGTEQVSIGDAQKAEGFRIADHALDQFVDFQRSRVRVWPPTEGET